MPSENFFWGFHQWDSIKISYLVFHILLTFFDLLFWFVFLGTKSSLQIKNIGKFSLIFHLRIKTFFVNLVSSTIFTYGYGRHKKYDQPVAC